MLIRRSVDLEPAHDEDFHKWLVDHRYERMSCHEQWGWQRPQIIPWVEVNVGTPTKLDSALDDAVAGLRKWQNITDTAIVTTAPGVRIYDELCARVPGMRIIPGVKTNDLLPHRFDDVTGWEKIGEELADMAQRTGSKDVVLENESAVKQYRLGHQNTVWAQLRKCLAQLLTDLTIWWYPAMTGENEDEQARMNRLSYEVANHNINVVLLDHQSCGGSGGLTYSWSIKGREKLNTIARGMPGTSIIPMLYFYGPDSRYWQDDQIEEALIAAASDRAIIYPGAARWVEAAKVFVKALGALPGATKGDSQ